MNLTESVVSLVKIALHPFPARIKKADEARRGEPLVVLGNGPSLNVTMAECRDTLRRCPLMAVNFFANTPVFQELCPRFYVLADPLFFNRADDANIARLMENLGKVTWSMVLFVPKGARCRVKNRMVTVRRFPMLGVEGAAWLERMAYGRRLGMPRPRNVLIPAIMTGIWSGFKEIYIIGADHSWMNTICVNEHNEVESRQPHFYQDNEHELKRIKVDYVHRPLHEVVHSFYVAFRAYHQIQRYASTAGVAIYNSTPGSFIDAFTRKSLPVCGDGC